MTSTESSVGHLIRSRRLALGMSMGQLANEMGLTTASVRSWERDEEVPSPPMAAELSRVLDLDLDLLVRIDDEPTAPTAVVTLPAADEKAGVPPPDAAPLEEAAEPLVAVAEEAPSVVAAEESIDDEAGEMEVPGAEGASSTEEETPEPVATVGVETPSVGEDEESTDGKVSEPVAAEPSGEERAVEAAPIPPPVTARRDDYHLPDEPFGPASEDARQAEDLWGAATAEVAIPAGASLMDPDPDRTVSGPVASLDPDPDRAQPALIPTPKAPARRPYWQEGTEKWRYWVRAGLTVVILVVFALIGVWALGELQDAVSLVLDQFGGQ